MAQLWRRITFFLEDFIGRKTKKKGRAKPREHAYNCLSSVGAFLKVLLILQKKIRKKSKPHFPVKEVENQKTLRPKSFALPKRFWCEIFSPLAQF